MGRPRGETPYLREYNRHANNARRRGIAFLMSFDDWLAMWVASGHLHERGCRRGQYVMARIDDLGAYEVANVYITQSGQNVRDRTLSLVSRAKLSASLTGHPASESRKEKISLALRGHEVSFETRRKMSESAKLRKRRTK
jgi:hypothetical protein